MRNIIKVDFVSNAVVLTKGFYEAACIFGTPENGQLLKGQL